MAKDILSFHYGEDTSNSVSRASALKAAKRLNITEQDLLRIALSTFILGLDFQQDDGGYPSEDQMNAIKSMVSQEPQGAVVSSLF